MIKGINHYTIASTDIDRSFAFYKDVLNFTPLCKWNNGAYFLAGDLWFCINYDQEYRAHPDYTHIAFDVSKSDFDKLKQQIIASGMTVFKENKSEGDSLYFLDPDGHKLEIHVGNWQSRISAKKANLGSWQNVEFFV